MDMVASTTGPSSYLCILLMEAVRPLEALERSGPQGLLL
jgi:hypothetical protein